MKMFLIQTPLGPMIAIGDEKALYLLEFEERIRLQENLERFQKKNKTAVAQGCTRAIESIEEELNQYFKGTLKEFKTPIFLQGTSFQKQTWEELNKIPYGERRSYGELAKAIDRPSAFRAVARANATNQLAIIVPCHRVIHTNGTFGGYAAGRERKNWLLEHERKSN